jgi:capsular polysaccharide biosynthesis protein
LWRWSPLKKGKISLNQENMPPIKYIKGRVIVLTQEGHDNYYHWITEILPKLELLKNIEYDWIYLPRLIHPFQYQTIALMGIDPSKVIEAEQDTYIEADEVIAPSYVSRSCYTPLRVAKFLQESFIKFADTNKTFPEKIFISRQKSSYRRVINEDAIFSLFESLGFKRINLEEVPFKEQVQLFNNARFIIAFHGAGLTNLIFCKQNTHVIEIFQEHEDDTYCYLSQTLNLKYECLKTTKFKKNGGYTDTEVPLDLIKAFLKGKAFFC